MPTFPGPSTSTEHAPAGPLSAVRGRILLHVKDVSRAPLAKVRPESGGVVFSGKGAREKVRDFVSGRGSGCPVVLDPSAYEDSYATAEEPFTLERQHHLGTRRSGLGATLEVLASNPAHLVLTPTRYLRYDAEGARALDTAVEQVNDTDVPNVVFAVPVDMRWLTDRSQYLVSHLRRVRMPKALILGSRGNPVASERQAKALREVVRACPDTALLRTDLAALDAMVYGAVFSSIGDTASVRHAVPPGKHGGPRGSNSSPNVLLPSLMGYFRGSTLAERLVDPPRCLCPPCSDWGEARGNREAGRLLSDFQDFSDTEAAHAHNMAVWSCWWRQLCSESSFNGRKAQWRGMCRRAYTEHEWHNRAISPRQDTFTATGSLGYWGGRSG